MQGDAGEIRIALAGDWATGTDEAHTISELIKAFKPHYTIHLGDVYYVGDPNEVDENFWESAIRITSTLPVSGPRDRKALSRLLATMKCMRSVAARILIGCFPHWG